MRVIVNGARGKMGRLAVETINQHADFQLVGAIGREDNLQQAIQSLHADIVIDVTRADAAYSNALAIIEAGAHPIIGTSGLMPEEVLELTTRCKQKNLGGIIAPNFSIGAILMMQFAATAARFFPQVEIIESHHPQKFDSPSGTAVKTAELIASNRDLITNSQSTHNPLEARGINLHGVPIHSLRLAGILAKQDVIFGSEGETLTITHNSIERSCFKPGIILCCQEVMHLNQLVYGLETILLNN